MRRMPMDDQLDELQERVRQTTSRYKAVMSALAAHDRGQPVYSCGEHLQLTSGACRTCDKPAEELDVERWLAE